MAKLDETPTKSTTSPPSCSPRFASSYRPPTVEDDPEDSPAQRKPVARITRTSKHQSTATTTPSKTSNRSPQTSSYTTSQIILPGCTIEFGTNQNPPASYYYPVHTNSAAIVPTVPPSNVVSAPMTKQLNVMDPSPRPSSSLLPQYRQDDTANEPLPRRRLRNLCKVWPIFMTAMLFPVLAFLSPSGENSCGRLTIASIISIFPAVFWPLISSLLFDYLRDKVLRAGKHKDFGPVQWCGQLCAVAYFVCILSIILIMAGQYC